MRFGHAAVIVHGEMGSTKVKARIMEEGEIVGKPGLGKFIPRRLQNARQGQFGWKIPTAFCVEQRLRPGYRESRTSLWQQQVQCSPRGRTGATPLPHRRRSG